jgi:hypothetical protein
VWSQREKNKLKVLNCFGCPWSLEQRKERFEIRSEFCGWAGKKKGKKNLRAYKEKERINLIWIFCWQFCFHKGKTILLMSVLDYYQGDWTGFGGAARLLP